MMTVKGKKILILTGRFGEGHRQAANALQEAARFEHSNMETEVVDFMQWAYPNLFPVSHNIFIRGIKTFPKLYGYLYKKTYEPNYFSKKLNQLFLVGLGKMLTLVLTEKPVVVVSTFPFSSYIFSKLKEFGLTNVPLITVITDHTHHSYWLHPCTNQYIVDSESTKDELIRVGIPSGKIAATGIPIRTDFIQKKNRSALFKKYQLRADLPTVLIMGGGDGLIGKGFLTHKTLVKIPFPLQMIVLCGHNDKLQQHLKRELSNSKHSIQLMGYTESVDELMAVSEIIVTKPGGVTTSEALAMQLPMLLYKPLPGQEQDNAQYLLDSGAAVLTNNPTELVAKLSELLMDRQSLTRMKNNAKKIQAEKAAFSALTVISEYLNASA